MRSSELTRTALIPRLPRRSHAEAGTTQHAPRTVGHAAVKVELFGKNQSTVTSALAHTPLKLLIPYARGESAWIYLSNFGGGLLAGDQNHLDITVGDGAKCFVGTQASSKIYRNPHGRPCSHHTRAIVGSDALLVMAPDTVQPFADSDYTQTQEFHLAPSAGLVLLDWFTSGRQERGERWAFRRYLSRNEIWRDGQRRILDSLLLDEAQSPPTLAERMGRYHCLALLLILGPSLAAPAKQLLSEIAATEVTPRSPLIMSASPVASGTLLRIAGETAELVNHRLHRHLSFLPRYLGDDPWARKW